MPRRHAAEVVREHRIPQRDGTTVRVSVIRQPRDQIGHWVAPPSMRNHPCPHSCCQGRTVHPDSLPVKLDRDYLRSLSARELGEELAQYSHYADRREHGLEQITAEIDRRPSAEIDDVQAAYSRKGEAIERHEAHRAKVRENARERRERREQEYRDEIYRQWLAAEAATKGVMLNREGKRRGIDERSLFTGPESRVVKYASPELFEWFETHGRPTRAAFLGSTSERRKYYAGRRIG